MYSKYLLYFKHQKHNLKIKYNFNNISINQRSFGRCSMPLVSKIIKSSKDEINSNVTVLYDFPAWGPTSQQHLGRGNIIELFN